MKEAKRESGAVVAKIEQHQLAASCWLRKWVETQWGASFIFTCFFLRSGGVFIINNSWSSDFAINKKINTFRLRSFFCFCFGSLRHSITSDKHYRIGISKMEILLMIKIQGVTMNARKKVLSVKLAPRNVTHHWEVPLTPSSLCFELTFQSLFHS